MSIANLTRAQIRTDIQTRLNEVGISGTWSTAELNSRIDRAVLRVQIDTESDTAEATISLRKNVAWYALPSDSLIPLFLYGPSVWSQLKLFPTSMTKMDRLFDQVGSWEMNAASRTTLFIPFSYDQFILWPAPDQNTAVTLFYCPVPASLSTDGSTTNLHLNEQKLIPIYATYLALRKHDFGKALAFLKEYKQRLAVVKSEIENRASVRPARMHPAKAFERAHATPELRFGSHRRGLY